MACTINVLSAIGIQDAAGKLAAVVVSGTQSGCKTIDVTIVCGATKGVMPGMDVTPGDPGNPAPWALTVPMVLGQTTTGPAVGVTELDCECGGLVTVEASCNNGECTAPPYSVSLQCLPPSKCALFYPSYIPVDPNAECKDGKHTVTGQIQVIPGGKAVGFFMTIKIGNSVVPVGTPHAIQDTPYTVSFSLDLPPGDYELMYWPTDLGECGFRNPLKIHVPACPGCPDVEWWDVTPGPCEGNQRSVTVKAHIKNFGVPLNAVLVRDGKTLDQETKSGAFDLEGTDQFSNGPQTVTVEFPQLPGCAPIQKNFSFGPCGVEVGGGGDDDESLGCLISRLLVVLLVGAALLFTLLWICTGDPFHQDAAIVAWIAAIGAFGLWWFFCGSNCGLLLIVWQSCFMGVWAAAYIAPCCATAIGPLVGLFVLASGFALIWGNKCKPSACKVWSELLWVTAIAGSAVIAGLSGYLGTILPCNTQLQDYVAYVHAGGLSVIATLVAKHCAKPAGG